MRSKRDFDRAFRRGSRARGSTLLVIAVVNELPYTRLGLSVGRSVWKRAVRRNRVRRIFREAFRLSLAELPAGFDLVLIAAAPRLEPRLDVARTELVQLARKACARARARAASAAPSAPDAPERRPAATLGPAGAEEAGR